MFDQVISFIKAEAYDLEEASKFLEVVRSVKLMAESRVPKDLILEEQGRHIEQLGERLKALINMVYQEVIKFEVLKLESETEELKEDFNSILKDVTIEQQIDYLEDLTSDLIHLADTLEEKEEELIGLRLELNKKQ